MDSNHKKSKNWAAFVKYSSIGFQLLGLIGFALYAGLKVDQYFNLTKIPVFTMIFILLVFTGFMFKLLKELK
jgi:ATP synthase protein I